MPDTRERPLTLDGKIEEFRSILSRAKHAYQPSKVFGMLSGGNDSTLVVHLAHQSGLLDAAVHINTGIGIPETRQFVGEFCDLYGMKLLEYHAAEGEYERIVMEYGFPGPAAHGLMYQRLKERPLRQLTKEHKGRRRSGKVMLVTGVRKAESVRRMGTTQEISKDEARIWVAPAINWTKADIREYRERFGLPENPVVAALGMSGECKCGAFAHPGELNETCDFSPEFAERIDLLSLALSEAGTVKKREAYEWGWGAYKLPKEKADTGEFKPLCATCELRNQEADYALS
jgi:3'-phosphoadenosine 5'-phosphosulfate sulfotransferase (PAPS reductase)/FAD synthetase